MRFERTAQVSKYLLMSTFCLALLACSNSSKPDPATTFSSTDLNGAYVFTAGGTQADEGDFALAGSFQADGKGNISSGVVDYNLGTGSDFAVPIKGTYTITSSGVALVTITDGRAVKDQLTITLLKSGTSPITNYNGTGSGSLRRQVASGFTPSGDYTFSVSGQGRGAVTASGTFSTDGAGLIFTGGQSFRDAVSQITSATLSGFVGPAVDGGRGMAAIGGREYVYYLVTSTELVLLGTEDRILLQGTANKH